MEDRASAINSLKSDLNQFTIRTGRQTLEGEKSEKWILQPTRTRCSDGLASGPFSPRKLVDNFPPSPIRPQNKQTLKIPFKSKISQRNSLNDYMPAALR